jgi:hypothetical protein
VVYTLFDGGVVPTTDQILSGLSQIANNWRFLAILWHVYFGVLALALVLGARPPKRLAGVLLGLPLFSVSALAWAAGNPFNGTFFALSGITSITVAARLQDGRVQVAPLWVATAGVLLFAFGWVYPHFLNTSSFLPYLYSAPMGLVPCPTISVVTGLALILGGLESRAWSLVLGITGIFYGIFGAARLGVPIDWVLLLGALTLVFFTLILRRSAKANPTTL